MERRQGSPRLAAVDITVGPPGGEPILRGVSIEVASGEWLGITGDNGSGKTTLALALAGLSPILGGRVTLDGELLQPGSATRTRIAAILQEPGSQILCDRVLDEIALGARNLGIEDAEAIARARQAAERLGIRELDENPATLSAGRQQVVLIAAALALEPRVLIADEACAHLDLSARERVLSVLEQETRHGLALLWVTQSPTELARADRVLTVARSGIRSANGQWPNSNPQPAFAPTDHPSKPAIGRLLIRSNSHHGRRLRLYDSIDIPIPGTGLVVVTGANGTGKTTLLECLAGARTEPEVEIVWRQLDSQVAGPYLVGERPETQIVHERVEDELVHGAVARGRERRRALAEASAILTMLPGGEALIGRRTWSLSAGEKRLVLNIGALITPASVLALDEPTAGLDVTRSEALAKLVQQRATHGPVFVSTQDLEWASMIPCQRLDLGHQT